MQLSKSFSLAEMTASVTADKQNIKEQYNPSQVVINNLRALCVNVLQPVRDILGTPIKITSGYRHPALNSAIGGSKTSQHVLGQAADIQCDSLRNFMVAVLVLDLPFDQIISEYGVSVAEPNWIHVSFVTDLTQNRKQILRKASGEPYRILSRQQLINELGVLK